MGQIRVGVLSEGLGVRMVIECMRRVSGLGEGDSEWIVYRGISLYFKETVSRD